ncbi:hypothetical protein ACSQ67_004590 [Phaseolus vulgaris]
MIHHQSHCGTYSKSLQLMLALPNVRISIREVSEHVNSSQLVTYRQNSIIAMLPNTRASLGHMASHVA